MRSAKLQSLKESIELMREISVEDAAIAIMNEEGIVEAFYPAKSFQISLRVGDQLPPEDAVHKVIQSGRAMYNKVPKEAFGVAIEGKIQPVFDEGKVAGVITYVFSTETQTEALSYTTKLKEDLNQTNSGTQEIRSYANDLIERLSEVQRVSEIVEKQIHEATSIVATIQHNASYSNILALNASIESARAGQAGRGFAVVAEEMGKFSKLSGSSAEEINKTLKGIVEALDKVNVAVTQSTVVANNQIEAVNNIMEQYLSVMNISNKLIELTETQVNYYERFK